MLVLGIESTCDETACAIVEDGRLIHSNIIAAQTDIHKKYGGVYPELASREHINTIIPVIDHALTESDKTLSDIDLIAVARGPGLIGSLMVGINTAKSLSLSLGIPYVGVNHVEAHLYAALMSHNETIEFPTLGVVLSGGHTTISKIENIGSYVTIGETVDDAVGEAFDKAAKILGLPYPGGPEIEKLARDGKPDYSLKAGQVKGRPFHFSFSGLKTAVLYKAGGQNASKEIACSLKESDKSSLAYAFQEAAFTDIIHKTLKAALYHDCKTILFGGGVTNSETLRQMFAKQAGAFNLLWPEKSLTLDNAAMIAGLGYEQFTKKGHGDSLDLEPATRLALN